jgi:hypothetical protein
MIVEYIKRVSIIFFKSLYLIDYFYLPDLSNLLISRISNPHIYGPRVKPIVTRDWYTLRGPQRKLNLDFDELKSS